MLQFLFLSTPLQRFPRVDFSKDNNIDDYKKELNRL